METHTASVTESHLTKEFACIVLHVTRTMSVSLGGGTPVNFLDIR